MEIFYTVLYILNFFETHTKNNFLKLGLMRRDKIAHFLLCEKKSFEPYFLPNKSYLCVTVLLRCSIKKFYLNDTTRKMLEK